jgi:hypothetical protein
MARKLRSKITDNFNSNVHSYRSNIYKEPGIPIAKIKYSNPWYAASQKTCLLQTDIQPMHKTLVKSKIRILKVKGIPNQSHHPRARIIEG